MEHSGWLWWDFQLLGTCKYHLHLSWYIELIRTNICQYGASFEVDVIVNVKVLQNCLWICLFIFLVSSMYANTAKCNCWKNSWNILFTSIRKPVITTYPNHSCWHLCGKKPEYPERGNSPVCHWPSHMPTTTIEFFNLVLDLINCSCILQCCTKLVTLHVFIAFHRLRF